MYIRFALVFIRASSIFSRVFNEKVMYNSLLDIAKKREWNLMSPRSKSPKIRLVNVYVNL